jgi:hypothetical protein
MNDVAGITLERYAELCAEVSDFPNDPNAQAEIVEKLGVPRSTWEAAQQGWTQRMQDMADMGQTATRFSPMYQAALAAKKGSVEASYDDWVTLNAAVRAYGMEQGLAKYEVSMAAWTQIAGTWNTRMGANMMQYASFHPTVDAEAQRLRAGGAPKPVSLQKQAGSGTASPAAAQAHNPQVAAQQYQNQMMAAAVQANVAQAMASANAQAAAAYGQASQNMGMLGRGMLGVMGYGAIAAGIGPGMTVLVQWSDGNRYPGHVQQVQNGQVLVAFQNGQTQWVPESAVTRQ